MPEPSPPRVRTVMAFDFSQKRIGIACGNTLTGTASPLDVLRLPRRTPDWPAIEALVREWAPDLLLVGLPLNMDGTPTTTTPAAEAFARQLQERCRRPVVMMDERLSTRDAREMAAEAGWGRDAEVDALAAQRILGSWMAEPQLGRRLDSPPPARP